MWQITNIEIDFDLCALVSGRRRCVRRTIAFEPCPELCPEKAGKGDHDVLHLSERRRRLQEKKEAMVGLARSGVVAEVEECRYASCEGRISHTSPNLS